MPERSDSHDPALLRRLGERLTDLAARVLERGEDELVTTSKSPEEIAARFDEPLPRAGRGVDDVLARIEGEVLPDTNHLAHPLYIGHQVSPPLPEAAAVDLFQSTTNNGMAVWEMSPVLTVVERRVLEWFLREIGWSMEGPDGAGAADGGAGGSFLSGGTVGNLTALAAARARLWPDSWRDGLPADARPCVVACSTSHYSIERACGLLGLGSSAVVGVPPVDGRMTPGAAADAIDRARAEGRTVLALVACAGSTTTGAVDDLAAMAELCEARGLWLHVDAAHGGAFLLSGRLRGSLDGIGRADSVAIDLHKMMFQPISSGMLLVRDRRRLELAFRQFAPYLFHERSDGPSWDLGRYTLQCSRRGDALRAWVTLQVRGADGVARLQEHVVDSARRTAARIREREDFELCHEPDTNILCFRHAPARLRGDEAALDRHNLELRERVNRSGRAFLTGAELDGRRVLRLTFINPRTELRHAERLLDLIEELA